MQDIQVHGLPRETVEQIRLRATLNNRAPEDEARIMVELSVLREELEETSGRLFRLLTRRLQLGESREKSVAEILARGHGYERRAHACG